MSLKITDEQRSMIASLMVSISGGCEIGSHYCLCCGGHSNHVARIGTAHDFARDIVGMRHASALVNWAYAHVGCGWLTDDRAAHAEQIEQDYLDHVVELEYLDLDDELSGYR